MMELPGYVDKGIIGMSMLSVEMEEALPATTLASRFQGAVSRQYAFKAITRGVSQNIAACELTHRSREHIDHRKAAFQLERYCELLRKWDVDLMTLPGSDSYPDCCFVQDTAIVLDEICIVANMGAVARRGETSEVEKQVSQFRKI